MLHLNDQYLIGEGCFKKCYHHPNDTERVIKIVKSTLSCHQSRRYVVRIRREVKALRQIAQLNELKHYFPVFYGIVQTNLGEGYVFQKVDPHVDIFRSGCPISRTMFGEIIRILRLMIRYDIPFCPDLMRNVFIHNKRKNIYFLDGLGCKYYIPATMPPFPLCLRRYLMTRMIKKHIIANLRWIRNNNVV